MMGEVILPSRNVTGGYQWFPVSAPYRDSEHDQTTAHYERSDRFMSSKSTARELRGLR
jgi:hypothetical protein